MINHKDGGLEMKRSLIYCSLALLLILSGCGGILESVPAAAPEASPEITQETESFGTEPPQISETPAPSREPDPVPTPTPEPTPTPTPLPLSLRELCAAGPKVLLDGQEIDSLLVNNTTLIRAEELMKRYPELVRWSEEGPEAVPEFWLADDIITPELLLVDGVTEPLEAYAAMPEGTGIYFRGQNTEFWLPIRYAAYELGLWFYWDGEEGVAYLSTPIHMEEISRGVNVPVLMYHAVSDYMWGINSLFVSPEDMRAEIEYLLDNGYDPIFFSDLTHLEDYDKPIILTFDDGYDDNYDYLFPLLMEYNVKATCFIITGMLGDEHYMTAEQAGEMARSGLVDVQSHTVDHYDLNELSYSEQEYQLRQSWLDVLRITGKMPYVVSYPEGMRDGNTLEIAPQYYSFGVDMNGGMWTIGEEFFKVDRIYISRFDTLGEFIDKIS